MFWEEFFIFQQEKTHRFLHLYYMLRNANDPWFKEPKDPFLQTEESGDDDCLRFTQTLVAETVQSVGLDEPGVMLCRFADGGC